MSQQPQTIIIGSPAVGPDPVHIACPSCRQSIRTSLRHEANNRTHIIALVLCLFLCWPCVCVPYCMNSCKNANHYCPSCGAFIGTYKK